MMKRLAAWCMGISALFCCARFHAAAAQVSDPPLVPCFDAVGTYLLSNVDVESGELQSRSLLSLTNGGHAFLTDSAKAGTAIYAPFTDGRGAWNCVANEDGSTTMTIRIIDFTLPTEDTPDQMIARLDMTAQYDPESQVLKGETGLFFFALDGDPTAVETLGRGDPFRFEGTLITAPAAVPLSQQ